MPGRPTSNMRMRPESNTAATSAFMPKTALTSAEKSESISMTMSGMETPEPPTGDTTEIRDAGRYNSSDYNNSNLSFNVNVRIENNVHARKQRRAVDRLLEKCYIVCDTGRAKLDFLGHMKGLCEDLLSGILGGSDFSLGRFDIILNAILIALEIISNSGFDMIGLFEVSICDIILQFNLIRFDTLLNIAFPNLNMLGKSCFGFSNVIVDASLQGYANGHMRKAQTLRRHTF
jgi:hypothetical protein